MRVSKESVGFGLADTSLIFICGHRGTGKSTWAPQFAQELPDHTVVDLDREIETSAGQSIREIFEKRGEATFRQLERDCLTQIVSGRNKAIVVLGGGCDVEFCRQLATERNRSSVIVWLRRSTDQKPRIFFDRPNLSDGNESEEYLRRYAARECRFLENSDLVWTRREGPFADIFERALWIPEIPEKREGRSLAGLNGSGIFTLLPRHIEKLKWLEHLPAVFEVRDDILSASQQAEVLKHIDHSRVLFSHRAGTVPSLPPTLFLRDWAVECGPCPSPAQWPILSCHDRERVSELEELGESHEHIKLAIEVSDFDDLSLWHRWFLNESQRRTFLPISAEGRWRWYRMWNEMGLMFFNDGVGEIGDQPSIAEWNARLPGEHFAAILGSPVQHSWTPVFHSSFFAEMGMPVLSIDISIEEWNSAMAFLRSMGLQASAVTAPLKQVAFQFCDEFIGASDLGSANTLWLGETVVGTNTDLPALEYWLSGVDKAVVWGGGGVLTSLQRVLPRAHFYSARTGAARAETSQGLGRPCENLIWAAGQMEWVGEMQPKSIWDLSYREDSVARTIAKRLGSRYNSGAVMFIKQAELQQEFWRECFSSAEG